MQFNTAVAAMMEYVNGLTGKGATREDLITLVKLVGPYAPHVGDEAWQALGEKGFLIEQAWPTFDDDLTIDDMVTMAIQVNGKMRGSIDVSRTIAKEEAERLALQQPNVQKHIEGKEVRKVVVVPGKIVNIVVA